MAGLWSSWLNPHTDKWERTFSILTGEASEVMRPIHDRQPEILAQRDYTEYLARSPLRQLRVLPSDAMTASAVEEKIQKRQQATLFDDEC